MRKMKLRFVTLAMAAILVTVCSQNTLAFYSITQKASNVVTSGDVQLKIHETTADGSAYPKEGVYIIPGTVVSKQVAIENISDQPFYLRVKIINGIDNSYLSAEDCFALDIDDANWIYRDGYYYYKVILEPEEITPYIFRNVTIVGDEVDNSYIGSMLTLTVEAQAVQSKNNPAEYPWEAMGWPEDKEVQ